MSLLNMPVANPYSAEIDHKHMARALDLAVRGEGFVEPNPMVGCVIVREGEIAGEGWHERFGGPHAEIHALEQAGPNAKGATLYVTLEPCCHHGKTPPCTDAIIRAGIRRVVVAVGDPFPQVAGAGIAALEAAGIECTEGILKAEARQLLAPYLKLIQAGRPWVIAKWAQTRDGMLAPPAGKLRWISNEASREVVQQLRGRVDGIIVGSGTVHADDPLLTARPADPKFRRRTPVRVVVDSRAALPLSSKLIATISEAPVLLAVGADARNDASENLIKAGAEVVRCAGANHADRLHSLLTELGRRRMTNVLVEGGGRLLKTLFDLQAVDEVHVFIAPDVAGGSIPSPFAGLTVDELIGALRLRDVVVENCAGDTYLHGRIG